MIRTRAKRKKFKSKMYLQVFRVGEAIGVGSIAFYKSQFVTKSKSGGKIIQVEVKEI